MTAKAYFFTVRRSTLHRVAFTLDLAADADPGRVLQGLFDSKAIDVGGQLNGEGVVPDLEVIGWGEVPPPLFVGEARASASAGVSDGGVGWTTGRYYAGGGPLEAGQPDGRGGGHGGPALSGGGGGGNAIRYGVDGGRGLDGAPLVGGPVPSVRRPAVDPDRATWFVVWGTPTGHMCELQFDDVTTRHGKKARLQYLLEKDDVRTFDELRDVYRDFGETMLKSKNCLGGGGGGGR